MKRRSRRLDWKIIVGYLAIHSWVVSHAEGAARIPLTNAMVVQALHVRGVEINAANVHLPMSLYAVGPSPTLTLAGVDRETNNQLRLRLRCVRSADCVAFGVTLDVVGAEGDAVLALGAVSPSVLPGRGRMSHVAVLHAGEHLALSIQQKHLSLKLSCVAIDTGLQGETIRVSTLDHRSIFHAVVTGPAAARGVAE